MQSCNQPDKFIEGAEFGYYWNTEYEEFNKRWEHGGKIMKSMVEIPVLPLIYSRIMSKNLSL